jgi:hypothetical protein
MTRIPTDSIFPPPQTTTTDIADSAVTTAKINDGAVTFAKLDTAAVTTSGEAIASNDSDTQVPTSAAVIDYVPVALNASGTAPIYACRAWVNFNGTGTVAIRASGNVSSITDNGTGDYTVNFTTAMPDADYVVVVSSGSNTTAPIAFPADATTARTTTAVRIRTTSTAFALTDSAFVSVAIFR